MHLLAALSQSLSFPISITIFIKNRIFYLFLFIPDAFNCAPFILFCLTLFLSIFLYSFLSYFISFYRTLFLSILLYFFLSCFISFYLTLFLSILLYFFLSYFISFYLTLFISLALSVSSSLFSACLSFIQLYLFHPSSLSSDSILRIFPVYSTYAILFHHLYSSSSLHFYAQ